LTPCLLMKILRRVVHWHEGLSRSSKGSWEHWEREEFDRGFRSFKSSVVGLVVRVFFEAQVDPPLFEILLQPLIPHVLALSLLVS
jgi:hypothetical protein